jgi:RNA polymerase sigma-70 factor (ECF subfamily)
MDLENKMSNNENAHHEAESAINGNIEAFERIYILKRIELYRIALKVLGSPEDAEDAVQEALTNVFQRIHTLKHPEALDTWMRKILYQRCFDIMRKRKRQVVSVLTDDYIKDAVADEYRDYIPEKHIENKELGAELRKAILALPEKSREAFILYYMDNMKYDEIAAVTNTSVKTVSTNLIRARRKLRAHLTAAGMALKGAIVPKLLFVTQGIVAKVGIGVACAVCTAGITWHAVASEAISRPEPEPENFAIVFQDEKSGGHINPKSIKLSGIRDGDVVYEWNVTDSNGGVVASGSLADVTDYVVSLGSKGKHGIYRIRCKITDKHGYEYSVSRKIAIGNYVYGTE